MKIAVSTTGNDLNAEEKIMNTAAITVIYDNNSYQEDLQTAWGFSCLIRGFENTILFDTGGDGSVLLANMKKLGIAPEEVELIVLSHMHWDHTGGVYHFIEQNPRVTLYFPESFSVHFKNDVERYGVSIMKAQDSVTICKQMYSSGELGRRIKEQALIIQTAQGLIIITGCAHPGIVNIVRRAKTLLKDDVLLVMGGFHLGGESKGTLEDIASDFKKLGVRYVGPCHCSGEAARQVFENEYQANFISVGVGTTIAIDHL